MLVSVSSRPFASYVWLKRFPNASVTVASQPATGSYTWTVGPGAADDVADEPIGVVGADQHDDGARTGPHATTHPQRSDRTTRTSNARL
jgi:hypothetical protein